MLLLSETLATDGSVAYFVSGSLSSSVTIQLTQLIMSCSSMYSGMPMRRQFEMPTRSTTSECSPEEPRAWHMRLRHSVSIFLKPQALISLGILMCTEPRMPVPRLDGQQVTAPNLGCIWNGSMPKYLPPSTPTGPSFLRPADTAPVPAERVEKM